MTFGQIDLIEGYCGYHRSVKKSFRKMSGVKKLVRHTELQLSMKCFQSSRDVFQPNPVSNFQVKLF